MSWIRHRGRWPAPWCAGALGLVLSCLLLLVACGPGEEGTGVQPASVSVGVLQGLDADSVTVNGVSYQREQAQVVDGFDHPRSADDLRLGMWVEVQGTVDDRGDRGVAQTIRLRPAARGVVSAASDAGITLGALDTEVLVGAGTVIDGGADVGALVAGDVVEVHGPLDNQVGYVRASRVEKLSAAPTASQPFELRGRVSALDTTARTLLVGRRLVSYAGARVLLRSALVDGMVVRVSATMPPVIGTSWAVEQLGADQPLPADLRFIYVEGFVSELAVGPLFRLEGLAVDASAANNRGALKADGQHVAVVGSLVGGVLRAKSVSVIEPGTPVVFLLSGAVSKFVSPAEFRLRDVLVDASVAEYIAPATAANLANGVSVRARGPMSGRTLIANRLELLPKPPVP